MKCDQDLCLNLWYDLNKLLWQDELNPRVRCAFGNVFVNIQVHIWCVRPSVQLFWSNLELWPRLCSSVGLAEEGVWSCEYKSSIPLKTAITYSFCHFTRNKHKSGELDIFNKQTKNDNPVSLFSSLSLTLAALNSNHLYPTILSPKQRKFSSQIVYKFWDCRQLSLFFSQWLLDSWNLEGW